MQTSQPNASLDSQLVGMTVSFPRLDFESAVAEVVAAGYGSLEIFTGQLGPGVFNVPGEKAHACAARDHLARLGVDAVMLNAIDGTFDPLRNEQQSVDALAGYLRLADALDIPRVMVWDGIHDATADVSVGDSPRRLAECIEAAQEASGVDNPAIVSAELHPFTFALAHDLLEETGAALLSVGAGICFDIAHFAVALGPEFPRQVTSMAMDAVNHVHWCDSDSRTDGFHLPPGLGNVNLADAEKLIDGRDVMISLDLFSWPTPREAMRAHKQDYLDLLDRHAATLGNP